MNEKEKIPDEAREQENFVYYVREHYPWLLIHCDDIAGMVQYEIRTQENFKSITGFRGYPDVAVLKVKTDEDGKVLSSGLFIEFKRKDTKLVREDNTWRGLHLAEQAKILQWLNDNGYTAVFARGCDEAIELFEEYMGNTEGTEQHLNDMVKFIEETNKLTKAFRPDIEDNRSVPYLISDNTYYEREFNSEYDTYEAYYEKFDELVKKYPQLEYWRGYYKWNKK